MELFEAINQMLPGDGDDSISKLQSHL